MATPTSGEDKLLLKQEVFGCARQGRVDDLRSVLFSLSPTLVEEVLHQCTRRQEQGRFLRGTPLTIAAEKGHLEVVQLLVDNFNVDLDQIVCAEKFYWTALMCASWRGHLEIVKLLVTKGCAVNIESCQKRPAVLFACERNHLDVVKFLVENGARLDNDNREHGYTCLMASCHERGEELVEYLLEKGADINKETEDGFTALHYAACNNCVKGVEILLNNGATMSSNSYGHSPLIEAAIARSREVVSFFVQSSYVGRKEKIDSLELLGAGMAVRDTTAAFEFLRQAMELRHEDPNQIIPKPYSRLPAPNSLIESRTLEELKARQLNPDQLHLECLTIALRILGSTSPKFMNYCLEYLCHCSYSGAFIEALTCSVHVLQVTEIFQISYRMNTDFMYCICMAFSDMLENGHSPRFTYVCKILELSLDILRQTKPAYVQSSWSSESFADLCLLCISVGLKVAEGQEDMDMLRKLTESFIHLQPIIYTDSSVLHVSVSTQWDFLRFSIPVQDLHVDSVVSFLLQCGADVNALDEYRNRPLHILAESPPGHFDAKTLRNLTHTLVEAGAPVAVMNGWGQTPLDLSVTEEMADILLEFYPLSLLSLAASAVVKHRVPYIGQVPEIMEEFLHRH